MDSFVHRNNCYMKASLKLLLLLTALVAVTAAWIRVRRDYTAIQSQIQRNANWNTEQITVSESNSPPSRLTIDASGAVSRVYLMGPAGIDAIRNHRHRGIQVRGVTFGSVAAVSAFDATDFPNVTQLGFDDSFDLDFNFLSLEWLGSLPHLEEVCFEARSSDPRQTFPTFPKDGQWNLDIWTDQIQSFDAFPMPHSIRMLSVHVPDTHDAEDIEASLKSQITGSHVVVWDNFGPMANPL